MAKRPDNTRAIDAVTQAHNSRRRPIPVPEWPGIDTLYFPPLTTAAIIAAEDRLGEREDKQSADYRHRKNVILLIQQAELEDGSQAFAFGDLEHLLQKADYIVMQRLINAVYSSSIALPQTSEEAKTESATTPSSVSR